MYINADIDWLKFLKNRTIYVFGAGKWGRKYYLALEKADIKVVAFIDNDVDKIGKEIYGKKIISLSEYMQQKIDGSIIVISTMYAGQIKLQLMEQNIFNYVDATSIDFGGGAEHYDEEYFKWQSTVGELGGKIKADIFKPYIEPEMTVVEFGCGGGYLLNNLDASEKIGIEINDTARAYSEKTGLRCYKYSCELPDDYADIIISTHVLEHTENPLGELRELYKKLKDGGKIVFHVPNESCNEEYFKSDVNNHLYTWNSLHLGNLFKAAGFFVYSIQNMKEVWPANWAVLEKQVSKEMFNALTEIRGEANDVNNCLIVAYK